MASLGETKIGTCHICQSPFQMVRFDQKFCSSPCRDTAKKAYHHVPWAERTDRYALNQKRAERYYHNHDEELERQRDWRKKYPELAKARDKQNYERNKKAHYVRAQKYRKEHPEIRKTEYHNARKKRPWLMALTNASNRSAKKGFSFDLTREWCEQTWTGLCAVSGLPFVFGSQTHFPFAPSIDRIDSSKGYTQDNCRFVLFAVNSLKGTGTDEQMLSIAQAIVARSKLSPL